MLLFITIILYFLVVVLDFIPVKKTATKKESAVYIVLLAASFLGLVLYGFNIKIPSPIYLITETIDALLGT